MPATATIPRYIPLSEAATQLNIGLSKLHDMASLGRIDAIRLPDGGLAVQANILDTPLRKEDLPEYQQFVHLGGIATWAREAEREYDVPASTISTWADAGFIKRIGHEGRKLLLDSQDVAYCAFVYQRYQEKGTQGRRIFNDDGMPYAPKTGPFAKE